MRIDLSNTSARELSGELSSQQVTAKGAAAAAQAGSEDRATFTSDPVSVKSLVTSALSSPEVRQSTVDSLKQAVSSGTYELNPSKIAASMVDDYA
jgi:flagellar biosynthesis anti-sigma factor FlgM